MNPGYASEEIFNAILNRAANSLNLTPEKIISHFNDRDLSEARQITSKILWEKFGFTLKDIGKYFGGRDHSTIIHGKNTANDLIKTNSEFREKYFRVLTAMSDLEELMKTENSYTPGPWKWQKFGPYYLLSAQHGMREIILGANKQRTSCYPSMNVDGILKPIDPTHPNARIISHAPDLLSELERTYIRLQELAIKNVEFAVYTDEIRASLRNTISEATGKVGRDVQDHIEEVAYKNIMEGGQV